MESRMNDLDRVQMLRSEMMQELKNEILPYWMDFATDEQNGGFVGRISGSNKADPGADKSVILNARLLWTFSAAYRILNDETYRKYADRAYHYMEKYFYDRKHGGFYWSLNHEGSPIDPKKHVYAHAFAIYGYSEYAKAIGSANALKRAFETFHLIEKHAFNEMYGGYDEAFTKDWKKLDDVRLSEEDNDEQRSMNTHLHVMEAYANLYRSIKDSALKKKLTLITGLMLNKIYDEEVAHFHTFFDEKWNSKADFYSYGHDIEAAWLLIDAAEVLENRELKTRAEKIARDTSYKTLMEGFSRDLGGVYNTGANAQPLDKEFHWWVQAESIVGFLYAYEVTGDSKFVDASVKIWEFIKQYVKDSEYGEWFYRLNEEGKPYHEEDKIGPWKCPYHNSRACLILIEKFDEDALNKEKDRSKKQII